MPIYDIKCESCGFLGEVIVMNRDSANKCPECGNEKVQRLISPVSSLTGKTASSLPGPKDTACCGSRPGEATSCAGPGSCCGRG